MSTKYERCSLSRLLRFLSARGIDPSDVTDTVSSTFLQALRNEGRLRIKPETFHQSSVRAWNKAVAAYPTWPQVTLTMPRYKTSKMTPWAGLPESLQQEVDAFLAAGSDAPGASLFDESIPLQRIKPTTAATQKDHIRCAASALIQAGQPPDSLTGLREIVAPSSFRLALEQTIAQRGPRLGSYIATLAWTLVKVARHAKVLTPIEVEEVNQLYRRLSARRNAEKPLDVRRDEALHAQLDDPRVMDAFLSLPSRTVERIIKSGRTDRMAALEVQKACALVIWLCAPLRLSNFVSLNLDQHFHRLTLKGQVHVLVRLAATEVKNAEAVEHVLSEEAADLLELYVRDFRPQLCGPNCPWLFPGYGDGHKVGAALSGQMKKYVEAATGVDFHPHLIRKISTKICLDEDPAAIEIVRRCLGHRNTNTTRQSYTQAQQRAAQTRYLEMLEKRQLRAIGGWQAKPRT